MYIKRSFYPIYPTIEREICGHRKVMRKIDLVEFQCLAYIFVEPIRVATRTDSRVDDLDRIRDLT